MSITFAVTRITGKVGGAVARSLLDAGLSVRAIVRDAAKGSPWKARRCEVAVGDLDDSTSLAAAFTGVDGAFAMLPPIFDPSPGFPGGQGDDWNAARSARGGSAAEGRGAVHRRR